MYPESSSSLVSRIRRHDEQAWQQLIDIYSPLVYSWARRGGLQPSDAADIVQNVFHKVATKLDSFGQKPGGRFSGWLWAICRNEVRLFYRKQQKQPLAAGGSSAHEQFHQLAAWEDESDEPTSVEERRSLAHRVLQIIRGDFNDKTWQAFWRSVIDCQEVSSIAVELELTPAAVRQAKYRVLCRIREELAPVDLS